MSRKCLKNEHFHCLDLAVFLAPHAVGSFGSSLTANSFAYYFPSRKIDFCSSELKLQRSSNFSRCARSLPPAELKWPLHCSTMRDDICGMSVQGQVFVHAFACAVGFSDQRRGYSPTSHEDVFWFVWSWKKVAPEVNFSGRVSDLAIKFGLQIFWFTYLHEVR